MAVVQARSISRGRGSHLMWVPGDATGFNLTAPFTVPSFGSRTTPNIARVPPARDFAVPVQATNPNNAGTHIWLQFYSPQTLALMFEFELNEFITQDGHNSTGFGSRSNRGDPFQSVGSVPYLAGFRFDNFDGLDVTVLSFDGLFCSW